MNTISIKAAGRGRFVTLAGAIIVCSIVFYRAPLGSQIETDWGLAALYSVRDRLRPISPPSGVALVKLDDGAAKSLGPGVEVERWPRTLHACLIEHLARLKPALICVRQLLLGHRGD